MHSSSLTPPRFGPTGLKLSQSLSHLPAMTLLGVDFRAQKSNLTSRAGWMLIVIAVCVAVVVLRLF